MALGSYVYVPAATRISSPELAFVTAAWIECRGLSEPPEPPSEPVVATNRVASNSRDSRPSNPIRRRDFALARVEGPCGRRLRSIQGLMGMGNLIG